MKGEESGPDSRISRMSLSVKVAEDHQAGSPAGTTELNVASLLFASRETLERGFI